MATNTKRSWGWAVLFFALAASDIAQLFLRAGHVLALSLMAVGFIIMALAALYGSGGFLAVTWQQLRSPRKLGAANFAGVVATAMLIVGTVIQWFKI